MDKTILEYNIGFCFVVENLRKMDRAEYSKEEKLEIVNIYEDAISTLQMSCSFFCNEFDIEVQTNMDIRDKGNTSILIVWFKHTHTEIPRGIAVQLKENAIEAFRKAALASKRTSAYVEAILFERIETSGERRVAV